MTTYQVMPDLSPEEYAELKADIAARGVQVAIEYDEDGNILDGHHRVKACQELGITDWPKVVRVGMTEEQKREHARKLNVLRRHMTREQRDELLCQQLKDTPEKSDRQIAQIFGVSDKTVGAKRKELEGRAEIPHVDKVVDSMGREQPRLAQRKPITLHNPSEPKVYAVKKFTETAPAEIVQAVAEGKKDFYGTVVSNQEKQYSEAERLMEEEYQKDIKKIDKESLIVKHLSRIIMDAATMKSTIGTEDLTLAARLYVEWNTPCDVDDHLDDCDTAIKNLQLIKQEFANMKKIRVVK